ncbi:hypothetical protein BY458DRAFT_521134 [Sporodiniella umbellata]|nr:hypothetical protein BY458DRAFT_521134 [Sporodiniella umbellata]
MGTEKIQNNLKVKELLGDIGKKKKWSEKDVKNDISILEKNRIFTVNDLKSLSRESWAQIELLPLVKDLLRLAIDPEWLESDKSQPIKDKEEKKEKKDKKKDKKKKKSNSNSEKKKDLSELGEPVVPIVLTQEPESLLCEDPVTIRNTIQNGSLSGMHISEEETETETETDEEPISPPTTDTPSRRKSVTFSDEMTFIEAAETKKDKKNKPKKSSSPLINTTCSIFSHPYTTHQQPLVKFKKLKMKHARRLPPVPDNDSFLQGLHDKLMANRIEQK